jgi:hypothetical protein
MTDELANLAAEARQRLIDDFVDEVFDGLGDDSDLQANLRRAPELPDEPTPQQVGAWEELAELAQDPDFRRAIRAMAVFAADGRARGGLEIGGSPDENRRFVARIGEHGGAAVQRAVAPESTEGAEILGRIMAGPASQEPRAELIRHLERFSDGRAERYWQLVGTIRGWPPFPSRVPAFDWVIAALRAHG